MSHQIKLDDFLNYEYRQQLAGDTGRGKYLFAVHKVSTSPMLAGVHILYEVRDNREPQEDKKSVMMTNSLVLAIKKYNELE